MKNPPDRLLVFAALLIAAMLPAAARAADGADVASPVKRQESLDRAKKFLAPRENLAPAADPFHSEAFDEVANSAGRAPGATAPVPTPGGETAAVKPAGPRTDRDILVAMAGSLKAPNMIVLNGQPVLLFGQKRVKAGSTLTINFEGADYVVEITAITPPNFTLRLNREEFTRPIK